MVYNKRMTDGFSSFDPEIAKTLNNLMDVNAKYQKEFIWRCYTDQDLISNYEGLRNSYRIEDTRINSAAMREIFRPPHPIILKFIDHEVSKKYGPGWRKDKETFRKACKTEPLIEPWLVVPKNKI